MDITFEVYEPNDDYGEDLNIIGETRKFAYKKCFKVSCETLSEQQLKNLGLINAELLKIEMNRNGSATIMVML